MALQQRSFDPCHTRSLDPLNRHRTTSFAVSTKTEDGDPADVLVLMDEPAFPGVLVKCRVIGVIEGEQGKRKNKNAMIASSQSKRESSYAHVKHIYDLGKKFVQELEELFVTITVTSKKYRILDVKGLADAWRRIEGGRKAVCGKG